VVFPVEAHFNAVSIGEKGGKLFHGSKVTKILVDIPKDHYMVHFTNEKDNNHIVFDKSWFDRSTFEAFVCRTGHVYLHFLLKNIVRNIIRSIIKVHVIRIYDSLFSISKLLLSFFLNETI